LKQFKNSRVLNGMYAIFLHNVRKDMDAAESHYKHALEADPNHAYNNANYALFLRGVRKDMYGAENHYKRALETEPTNASIISGYANYLREARNFDLAETYFKRALETDPKNIYALGNYANFLRFDRKDMDGAETYYKRGLDTDPNNTDNLGNYAQFILSLGRQAEGLEILNRIFNENLDTSKTLRLELLVYRFAHDEAHRTTALKEIKKVLAEGQRTPGWNFQVTIDRATQDAHPDIALLSDIVKVANEGAKIDILDRYPAWRAA
jgi:Tfp pilus assembly protein PilF